MGQRKTFLTSEGLTAVEVELRHLRNVRRQDVALRIHNAQKMGGILDNAEYDDAKNEQAFLEGRILTLENMVGNVVLIPDANSNHSEFVDIGSVVTLFSCDGKSEKWAIVGSTEADPHNGRISNESPVGSALIGRKVGDVAEVFTPAGRFEFKIVGID